MHEKAMQGKYAVISISSSFSAIDAKAKGKVEIDPSDRHYLRTNSEVKDPRESAVKYALLDMNIPSYYEHMQYPLSNSKAYFPDFTTALIIDGRQVILEPHGNISLSYLQKLNEFIKSYGFYVVLISNKPFQYPEPKWHPGEFVDDYWYIKGFDNTSKSLNTSTGHVEKKLEKLLRKQNCEVIAAAH